MKKNVGMWMLYLSTAVYSYAQVDTSFIYNTNMPYGALDLRLAKSATRYYYLQEGITFSYRESAPGVKTNTYTSMTNWNTSAYTQGNLREKNGDADYFIMNYRLLKPQNYNASYSPGYPIIIMLHGAGEAANCWIDERCYWATANYNPVSNTPPAPTDEFHSLLNNDRNLLHGGAQHLTAVNLAGSKLPDDPSLQPRAFPGFVLFPQSMNGWGPRHMVEDAIRILRLIIKQYNIDPNRVFIHGLSNGGGGVYEALKRAPWLFTAALPMSAVRDGGINNEGNEVVLNEVAKLPLWIFQGGQDMDPTPGRTYNYVRRFRKAGASVRYYLYPHLGHGTWNTAYNEPDFFSWMLEKRKYNPHIYYGSPTICNTTQVGAKLGFSRGFFAYQWQRDGQTIPGATGAELVADTPGTYRGRFSRKPNPVTDSDWERWSDPVVVSEMIPDKPSLDVIGSAHLRGPGLASTLENNTVRLRSADSAELYLWYKDGSPIDFPGTNVEDTFRLATIRSPFSGGNGTYTLVTQTYNCPSPPSDPINLFFNNTSPQNIALTANAVDFKGTVAAGSIFLSWNDVSGMEMGYEIWRRKAGTTDFGFVTRTGEDAVSFHDIGLDPQSTYEYKFRAVNNSGRSNYLPSDDLAVNYKFTTSADNHFPPPPQNLKVVANTLNTITLSWKPARDERSVKEYYIYYNNDSISTGSNATTDTLTGLPQNTVFAIRVKAVDFGNHFSQPSNQIIATTYLSGLLYKHSTGAWESLDDSAMVATWNSPEFTGTVPNFTLQPRTQEDYFNFQFTGYLNIETEGTYYFNLTSSDGSRLIIDGNVIVNNDGLHGTRTVASEGVFLTVGPHAIEVQYFDDTGGHTLTVRYRGPGVGDGTNFIAIPDAALRSGTYIPPAPPPPPLAVAASGVDMRRINVAWQFADDDQTDYEVYRALTSSGPYEMAIRATGTSATDSIGLLPGTQYYYKVKTVNNNGSSAFSNVASATTIADSEPPTVPEALVLISKTMTHIAFSWNASTDNIGVTHYEIYSGDELIGTSTIHAFMADDLTINTGYQFTVKAVDASGNKSASSTALAVETNTSAIFYSLAAGDLNALATWRRNADGTGESPVSFSDNGQYFIISNRTSASLGGPWTIGGSSSLVIVPTGVTLTADDPFSANVELQGDAVLSLNNAVAPDLVKLSPQSTVIFNAYPRIPANSYGNIILSGSVPKTFDADTITILGNLTLNDGMALKGSSHNSSYIQLSGTLSLLGSRPATAADNTIDLAFTGASPTSILTGSDVYLFRITTAENQIVNIIHPSGIAVKINLGSLNGGGLVIADGSSVNINDHDLVLGDAAVVNPDQHTGTLQANGGNVHIASTSAKNSNLYFDATNHRVNLLTVDATGAGSVSVRSSLEIAEGIKIRNGTLVSGGNITLLATAERTASIYEIENAGAITGEVTVQQHLPAKGTVNGYLSAPVNNVTVSEWQQSFPITGSFSGASGGAGTAPSLFYYRDNNGGWIAYPPAGGANTAPIEKGVGYAALLRNNIDPITLAVKGNPYQGSIQYTLTGGDVSANSNGWNLVGNPFASPVLWNKEEGAWGRSGVNNVVAIRGDTSVDGRVRSQVTYYDLQLGGGVIPQGKAFWVRTYTASPSLSIQESAKVDPDPTPSNPSAMKHMIVKLKQGEIADAAYIVFSEEGTEGLDPQLDGRKLPNLGMFNFSTITADTISLAVNHLSDEFCSLAISLNVANVSPGSYFFSFENIQALTDIRGILLTDHFTATSTPITGADYTFSVTEDPNSFGRSRFSITFSKEQLDITGPQLAGGEVCAPGPGYLTVSNSQEGAFYQALDDAGKSISDMVEGNGGVIEIEIIPDELTEGANIVMVTAGFSGCDRQPLPGTAILNYFTGLTVTTGTDVSVCEGEDITLEASGAPTGGFYQWFDSSGDLIEGASGPTLVVSDILSEAVYYVAVAHANGCQSDLAEIHIYTDSLDVPVIESKEDTLFTNVVAHYQWKKDGDEIPGAMLNYYVPVEEGKYSVVASSGGCFRESAAYEFGDPVTGIGNGNNNEFVLNIFPVPSPGDRISVLLRSPKTEPVLIEIIDALGRLYYRQTIDAQTLMQGTVLVPYSTLYNGIYFLRATQAEIRARKKIIVKN